MPGAGTRATLTDLLDAGVCGAQAPPEVFGFLARRGKIGESLGRLKIEALPESETASMIGPSVCADWPREDIPRRKIEPWKYEPWVQVRAARDEHENRRRGGPGVEVKIPSRIGGASACHIPTAEATVFEIDTVPDT